MSQESENQVLYLWKDGTLTLCEEEETPYQAFAAVATKAEYDAVIKCVKQTSGGQGAGVQTVSHYNRLSPTCEVGSFSYTESVLMEILAKTAEQGFFPNNLPLPAFRVFLYLTEHENTKEVWTKSLAVWKTLEERLAQIAEIAPHTQRIRELMSKHPSDELPSLALWETRLRKNGTPDSVIRGTMGTLKFLQEAYLMQEYNGTGTVLLGASADEFIAIIQGAAALAKMLARYRGACDRICTVDLFLREVAHAHPISSRMCAKDALLNKKTFNQLSPSEWVRLITTPWYSLPSVIPAILANRKWMPDHETFITFILMFHLCVIGKGRTFPE